jgi:hypothetical protein
VQKVVEDVGLGVGAVVDDVERCIRLSPMGFGESRPRRRASQNSYPLLTQ